MGRFVPHLNRKLSTFRRVLYASLLTLLPIVGSADIAYITDNFFGVYALSLKTGQWSGPINTTSDFNMFNQAIAISGDKAYVTNASLDEFAAVFSVPLQTGPLTGPLNTTTVFSDGAVGIAISGNTAYITNARIDSNADIYTLPLGGGPWHPLLITGSIAGDPRGIAISGNTAYVTNELTNVYSVPLVGGSWSSPINSTSTISGRAWGIAISGNTAYVTNNGSDAHAAVYALPLGGGAWMSPINTSGTFSGQAFGIAISGNTAYVTNGPSGADSAVYSVPLSGGAWSDPINTTPIPSGHYAYYIAISPQLPTQGLRGQELIVAEYLNQLFNDLYPPALSFVPIINASSEQALNPVQNTANNLFYICPARNALPIFAAANAQFAASDVVQDHQRMKRFVRHTRRRLREQEHHKPTGYNELFSDATQELLLAAPSVEASATPSETDVSQQDSSASTLPEPKTQMATEPAPSFRKMVSPWFEVFGEYARQKAQKETPSFKDSLGGAVLALDLYNYKTTVFGAGLAYTYSYVHEGAGAGHATINQEYAVVYGTFEFRKFYADPAVWGALMQISNTRHIPTLGLVGDARSSPHGWMLSPHLEIGYDIDRDWLTVEPFAMFDWPNVWEDSFHEEGAGSLNMTQPQHHSSMLRSELGFRFYQAIRTRYARCILQEKASYVNKKPFEMGSVTAFITGAPGSFTVDTLSGDQNLGCAEIEFLYDPDNKSRPYISVSYQGETTFTGAYYSHLVMASMGKEF